MTPRESQAMAERVREAITWARDLVRRGTAARAMAAELTVIADELRARARAECERARELGAERLRCHHEAPPCLRTPTRSSGRAGRRS